MPKILRIITHIITNYHVHTYLTIQEMFSASKLLHPSFWAYFCLYRSDDYKHMLMLRFSFIFFKIAFERANFKAGTLNEQSKQSAKERLKCKWEMVHRIAKSVLFRWFSIVFAVHRTKQKNIFQNRNKLIRDQLTVGNAQQFILLRSWPLNL